jgi:Fuc2NAc and GlcNAc transferase
MRPEVLVSAGVALLVSAALTALVRKLALSHGVLDVPNARSSHKVPTPRGGGTSIVLTTAAAVVVLYLFGTIPLDLFLALTGGGLVVALIGFLDDRHKLSARIRLAVHLAAALWAVFWLGGLPALRVGAHLVSLGWLGNALATVAVVWTLNLFNFMDGIDGSAASEAVFVAWGAAFVALLAGTTGAVSAISLAFGAACCGFLWWNWPPARIFMGDVGSGYLGYVIAVMSLAATREDAGSLWVWMILGGVFFVDATVTLISRALRRERVQEAHCSHAYQWLARRWQSHLRVTMSVILVNVLWLLPCAIATSRYPAYAVWIVLVALAPLIPLVLVAGAGRSEPRSQDSGAARV